MPGFEQDRLLLALASGVLAQTFLVRLLPPWLVKPLKRPWPALKELRVGTNHARNGLHTHPSQLLLSLPQNTLHGPARAKSPHHLLQRGASGGKDQHIGHLRRFS